MRTWVWINIYDKTILRILPRDMLEKVQAGVKTMGRDVIDSGLHRSQDLDDKSS